MVSIIVPAHDEEHLIGRCLSAILRDAEPGEFDVVVVANGCHDRTADIAREFEPRVRVIETAIASKPAALDIGDRAAQGFPRMFIDADVEVGAAAVRAVADELSLGRTLVAAPRMTVDTEGCPWMVRAFYHVWQQLPYAATNHVGSGFYGVSEAARDRFDAFNGILAEDMFIRSIASSEERRTVREETFVVHASRDVSSLVKICTRWRTNNRRDRDLWAEDAGELRRHHLRSLGSLALWPRNWPQLAAYLGIVLVSELLAIRKRRGGASERWERDESTRGGAQGQARTMTQRVSMRRRLLRGARSALDPRPYLHFVRLAHYFNYSHLMPLRRATVGRGTRLAPNVSLTNGERITIGAGANIGSRCHLWAGNNSGRVILGDDVILAPEVFITASNYQLGMDARVIDQRTEEADVVIGPGVWLGARVIVLPGVSIGEDAVVGAGAVVTKSIPPRAIAVGVPARVVGHRARPSTSVDPVRV